MPNIGLEEREVTPEPEVYRTFEVPASNKPLLVRVIGVPEPERVKVLDDASRVSLLVDPPLPIVKTLVVVALLPRV